MTHRNQSDASASSDISGIDCTTEIETVEPQRFAEAYITECGGEQRLRMVASGTEWVEADTLVEVRA